MDLPRNHFKAALAARRHQLGIWNTIGGNTVAETLATCGYDWVLVDCEHAAVETIEVLPALQAIAGFPEVSAVVRPAANDPVLIKRLLDFGAQSLLIPYVQSAEEAEAAVAAMRYAPAGMRGLAGVTRATRYGKVENYHARASDELCLIVQVETVEAVERLEQIAGVPGVDGVFIGPADLSASMGYPGDVSHPEVVAVIEDTITRIKAAGKPAGILTLDPVFARRCMDLGTGFTAVGVDLALLVDGATALRKHWG